MVSEITVPFAGVKKIPDPTKVVTTWEWYFLDQISSSLVKWNPEHNAFEGVLAESWSFEGSTITFRLKNKLFFSDGRPLTAMDVAASVKRTIIKKSSSHFKPWELLIGCEGFKDLSENCPGIQVNSESEITFNLRFPSESFLLFMACPEGGIWSIEDLLETEFNPKRFSGPYFVESKQDDFFLFSTNKMWVSEQKFPNRPSKVKALWSSEAELKSNLASGKTDIMLDLERPFAPSILAEDVYETKATTFNTLYYLFKVRGSKNSISRRCLEEIWNQKFPEFLEPAFSYLPFEGLSGISKQEILLALPNSECLPVRVGYLKGYFSEEFVRFLFSEDNFKLVPLDGDRYFSSFSSEYKGGDIDFVMSPYVASERYPSVQIGFLMEDRKVPFDLSSLDHRDKITEKKQLLHQVQKWSVESQQVIPVAFGRSILTYKKNIDIGNQPLMDSELQLWRVNERYQR